MSHRLTVEPVASSSRLRRSLSPGQADQHGEMDGQTLIVDAADDAQALVDRYPNVRWADAEPVEHEPEMPRMEMDNEGSRVVNQGQDLSERSYSELRSMAADADTDEIDGRSSKADILDYFEGDD